MKLSLYVELLNNLLKDKPHVGEFKVITASDQEGNHFEEVVLGPSVGHFDERMFFGADDNAGAANSVCVN